MAAASFGRRFQRSFLLGRQYSDRSPPTLKRAPRFQVDTNSALSGKTRREVFRGWMVYKLLSYNWIVQSSMELYGVSRRFLGQRLTESLLRATVAGQFLGGFSEEEVAGVAENLASKKICSLWAYSKEIDLSESQNGLEEANFDDTNNLYLQSIQASGRHNYHASPVKFVAVKVTAIVNPTILLKLSLMLAAAQQHKVGTGDMTEQSAAGEKRRAEVAEWMQSFKIHENLSRLQAVSEAQGCRVSFSEEESQQLRGLIRRLDELGECAVKENVRILVDAEESRLQAAIHYLTVNHMMAKFNLTQPYIYNTIQMYLKSSLQVLLMDIATAKSAGFKYGLKMVRGAYMQYERLTADSSGTEYPVLPNKEATNNSYNEGLRLTIGEIAGGGIGGMIVASHNQESVELGVDIMEEFGIPRDSGAVCFGQLLGMGDHLSYPLAQNGYIVQKCLTYGDADDVFPFLARRGQENDQTSENAKLERQLYAKEMKRRWLPL